MNLYKKINQIEKKFSEYPKINLNGNEYAELKEDDFLPVNKRIDYNLRCEECGSILDTRPDKFGIATACYNCGYWTDSNGEEYEIPEGAIPISDNTFN